MGFQSVLSLNTMQRAANRLKREARRVPPVRMLREYSYHQRLQRHAPTLPSMDPQEWPIYEGLRRDGVHQVAVDALNLEHTEPMLAALQTLVGELSQQDANGQRAPRLPFSRVMDFPEIYLWGLDERLLRLIENYVGLPVKYFGPDVRREFGDHDCSDVRQWHLDVEDFRMVKIIIYLNDVGEGGGPFEYMNLQDSREAADRLGYVAGFVTDDRMNTHGADRSRWVEARAPRHTAIFADTCRVFHRAQPPRGRDRYSVTFSWVSTAPAKKYEALAGDDGRADDDETKARILASLSPRQRAALPV